MKSQFAVTDTKLTDRLERQLIEEELGTPRGVMLDDVKVVVAALQRVFQRLQGQARKSKIEFANG
jgi:hypothetical protein